MAAPGARLPQKFLTLNDTLSAGISKVDPSKRIVEVMQHYGAGSGWGDNVTVFTVNQLSVNIPADAAQAFGQKLADFPAGFIMPVGAEVALTRVVPTGLSSTAGNVGLGTTVASGAVAVLGGTAAFGDIMEGTTVGNQSANTTLTEFKANAAIGFGTQGVTAPSIINGSSSTKSIHLNFASTFDQTAAENLKFSAVVTLHWRYVSRGA